MKNSRKEQSERNGYANVQPDQDADIAMVNVRAFDFAVTICNEIQVEIRIILLILILRKKMIEPMEM